MLTASSVRDAAVALSHPVTLVFALPKLPRCSTTIHCGQELIDQSFRGVDDVFGTRERAAFDIVDIVPETFDSLYLDRLLHRVEVSILFGVSRIRRSMTAEDVFGEHELNIIHC